MPLNESTTITPANEMAESARMRLSSRLLAGTRHYADSVSRSGQFAHTVRGGERWRRRERERRQQAEECLPLQQKGIGDGGGQVGHAEQIRYLYQSISTNLTDV